MVGARGILGTLFVHGRASSTTTARSSYRAAGLKTLPVASSLSSSSLDSTGHQRPLSSFCGTDGASGSCLSFQRRDVSGSLGLLTMRIAQMHWGRLAEAPVEPTYGVGPVLGPERDPKTKGSTPDDGRADFMHMAEPKEVTKEKAAVAQQEPPDFQMRKTMPEWEKPVEEKADSQRDAEDKVFEDRTRKVQGTAEKQGNTTGNESGDRVEGQYGAAPSEGKTGRS